MKIYFAFTVMAGREKLETARNMMKLLRERGHEVLTTHLFADNVIENESRFTREFVFERDMKWLEECDAVIAEVSSGSFGIGFEAGFVLGSSGKKVYLFYDTSMESKVSKMATGNTLRNCVRVPYGDFDEAKRFIEENF